MQNNVYDIGIIGSGPAGLFAALKVSKGHKDAKVIVFDLGRAFAKRRRQVEGALGCWPSSDGKLYSNDVKTVSSICGTRRTKAATTFVQEHLSKIIDMKVIKDNGVSISLEKKIKKQGYSIITNDYIQTYPKDIHSFSKYMATELEKNKNVTFSFDNEVFKILKQKKMFHIISYNGEFICKKIIICVGRSGWRWAQNLYNSFGIIENNDYAKFGIRVEMQSTAMKDFNKSHCTIKNDELEIGPLSWFGTVIPEDHVDMAISAFRGNENRWKTDKVSFNLIGNRYFKNKGFEQTDRLAKLTFILSNDRIIKEKVSALINKKSKISIMTEYDWLIEAIDKVSHIMPELPTKGYFHIPTIIPMIPQIKLGDNLETDVDYMYAAGESAGVTGLLGASILGTIAATSALK